MVREDGRCRPLLWWRAGRILEGSVVVDPGSSVVPLSLQVSMVVEGFHGNRGLVPSSPSVRLRIFSLSSP